MDRKPGDVIYRRTHAFIHRPADSVFRAEKSDEFADSMHRQESGPDAVSRVIQQEIESPRPKARYLAAVDFSGRLVLRLRDFVWDAVLQRMFKLEPAASNSLEK